MLAYITLVSRMGNSFVNTNMHIIFHVKNQCSMREPDLSQVFHYIGGIIRSMSGISYRVGGMSDHIHILATLPCTICLSDFVRTIKASTSKWIKGLNPYYKNFSWQEGYGAFSVSKSNVDAVISYINNQKEHHSKRSAQDEFHYFLSKHGLLSE